jgi:hypothetical protein
VKRTPLAIALVFLMLSIVSLPIVELAVGNPSIPPSLPKTPDKNEPTVTVNEPDNTVYSNTKNVHYSVTVRKPSSWFDYDPIHGQIMLIWYTLDTNKEVEIADEPDYRNRQPLIYEGDLNSLSDGNHSFQIRIRSCSYYNSFYDENNSNTWKAEEYYYIDTYSEKTNFTVNPIPSTLEPSPTIQPTQSSATPSNSIINDRADFPAMYVFAIVVTAILAIVIGALLLLRSHRKTAKA